MAAIIPHLEHPEETTPLERQFFRCLSGEATFGGAFADGVYCPAPGEVQEKSHQELTAMVYVRDAVERELLGRAFTVEQDKSGRIIFALDGPIGYGPPWNPAASPSAQRFSMLTWTSKMNAPSWSLPAGAPQAGGACPGATGAQSIVPLDTLRKGRAQAAKYVGEGPLAAAVCEHCYATGGQYATGNVQYAQVLRYIWAREAIQRRIATPFGDSTLFVETMSTAIANANFKLDGGRATADDDGEGGGALPREPSGRRFFRIHDSGDFFSIEYLRQWKAVAERFPDVTFWAPSRVWAAGDNWIRAVNEINAPRPGSANNLVIRPSAYYVDGHAPRQLGAGWAAGTTVVDIRHDGGPLPAWREFVEAKERTRMPVAATADGHDHRYQWSCRAYSSGSKNQCRSAVAPPGFGDPTTGRGCRVCWLMPEVEVNYHPH